MSNVVLVLDMLVGFMEPGKNLYCGDEAREIIPNIQKLIESEQAAGSSIIFVADTHDPDDLEFEMFPVHCVRGTEECEVIPELAEYEGVTLRKRRYSAFYETDLAERLAALLHDAPEYVIGDMISPFKAAIGLDYKDFEHRLAAAVHIRFGLPPDLTPALAKLIKRADRLSAWFEATQLAGFSEADAAKYFLRPRFEGAQAIKLKPRSTNAVKRAFLAKFRQLYLQVRR